MVADRIGVERVDFIAVPVSDLARADEFYGGTLGLARNPHASGDRWVEYETGNVTIALSMYGGGIALRVPDVAEARSELERDGFEFAMDTFDTGACHGAPLRTPTAIPCSSTSATPRSRTSTYPLRRFSAPTSSA